MALIKIDPPYELSPVYIDNSDSLEVGDWVLAIGHQFQLGQTVTAGIVSAKSRRVSKASPYDNYIQTDASINPGSSGGPLFNTKGQVVGINTAIYSPGRSRLGGTGFNIGIGFAIPIGMARSIIEQLGSSGKVVRGWLGVLIQPINEEVQQALQLPSLKGALVGHVMAGSPAKKAGIQVGDIIKQYSGRNLDESSELPLLVANTAVGSEVSIMVERAGKLIEVPTLIEELSDSKMSSQTEVMESQEGDVYGFILTQTLTNYR